MIVIAGIIAALVRSGSSAWPQAQSGKGDPTSRRGISPPPLAWKPVVLPKTVILAFSALLDGH